MEWVRPGGGVISNFIDCWLWLFVITCHYLSQLIPSFCYLLLLIATFHYSTWQYLSLLLTTCCYIVLRITTWLPVTIYYCPLSLMPIHYCLLLLIDPYHNPYRLITACCNLSLLVTPHYTRYPSLPIAICYCLWLLATTHYCLSLLITTEYYSSFPILVYRYLTLPDEDSCYSVPLINICCHTWVFIIQRDLGDKSQYPWQPPPGEDTATCRCWKSARPRIWS